MKKKNNVSLTLPFEEGDPFLFQIKKKQKDKNHNKN